MHATTTIGGHRSKAKLCSNTNFSAEAKFKILKREESCKTQEFIEIDLIVSILTTYLCDPQILSNFQPQIYRLLSKYAKTFI